MSDFLQRLAQRSLGLTPTLDAWTPGLGPTDGPDSLGLDVILPPGQTETVATRPTLSVDVTRVVIPLLQPQPSRPIAAMTRLSNAEPDPSLYPAEPTTTPRGHTQSKSLAPLAVDPTPFVRVGPGPTTSTSGFLVEESESPGAPPAAAIMPKAGVEPLFPRERRPRVEWPSALPVAPTTEPTATIKVSIGRVEVRAITAPPTRRLDRPPDGRPDASRLTLREYLRQGSGGAR